MAETSISLRGLASQLGLAPSTVSVALRPGGRIAEKTRQRVLEAAEALGYRPDPVLSALSRRKHGTVHGLQTVAVLVPAVGSADGIAPTTRVLAERSGYRLELFGLNEYARPAALGHVLYHRGVAGVLVPEDPQLPDLSGFPWRQFSAVQCGVVYQLLPIDLVRFNPFDCASLAWAKLVAQGYRRIGVFMLHHPIGPSPIDEKMVAAFQYCQQRDAALVDPVPLHYGPTDKLHEDYAPWFERGRPEAVIGPWDGLYRMRVSDLPKNGTPPAYVALRAREDSSVAGFLTAREQVENIALRHLDQLIRHNIKGASDPKTTLVLEPVWKPGRTLPEEAG